MLSILIRKNTDQLILFWIGLFRLRRGKMGTLNPSGHPKLQPHLKWTRNEATPSKLRAGGSNSIAASDRCAQLLTVEI